MEPKWDSCDTHLVVCLQVHRLNEFRVHVFWAGHLCFSRRDIFGQRCYANQNKFEKHVTSVFQDFFTTQFALYEALPLISTL